MPRQRTHHSRRTFVYPDDFPRRLERFGRESGLTWAEMARRLGTHPQTIRRWRAGVRPNSQHLMALLRLAESLRLGHLLTGRPDGPEPDDREGGTGPAAESATEIE